jgi:two-component system cell cycle response regulator
MTHKEKILIVDDEPLNIKLLAAKLPPGHYEIMGALSGREALEKVAEEIPDLILLDVMMPDMDGYEVTRVLKSGPETKDIPIVMVTALDGEDDKAKGIEAGADEFLNKPVNTAEFASRVKSLLRLKQYQDQIKTRRESRDFFAKGEAPEKPLENKEDLPSVLIVENDLNDAKLIRSYLEGQPYRVGLSRNGEDTLARARREKVDLILLDILLPGLDGFEVCKRLKEAEETRNIQVVVITSLKDLESKIKGIDLGVDDFLVKPVNVNELRARIRALVKKKGYLDQLHASYEQAVHSAIQDSLTGLYNRAYFEYFLELEVKRALRQKQPLALAMIDIDDFKEYNDRVGHLAGDGILVELGRLIKATIRNIDLGARYGGEEFVLVLPGMDLEGAVAVAERIRLGVREHSFPPKMTLPPKKLTVSVGVAVYPEDAVRVRELIHKADSALYKAKSQGKNQSVCFSHLAKRARAGGSRESLLRGPTGQ